MNRSGILFILPAVLLTAGCEKEHASDAECRTTIEIYSGTGLCSRSADPDEDLVHDVNVFIFDDRGMLERNLYMKTSQMIGSNGKYTLDVDLHAGATYSVYVLANAGYSISMDSEQDIQEFRYYFAYPDEYRIGIPMSGKALGQTLVRGNHVVVPLERTMAKISVCIDRSRLDEDVTFDVTSIRVGGCPKSVTPFSDSAVKSGKDVFAVGFIKSGTQVIPLNTDTGWGKSGEISLYMFENMQGDLLNNAENDSDKVLDPSDPMAKLCSYIEIRGDYMSDSLHSIPGKGLIYRFYLGESNVNFDVRRNTHYHITVTPENDGLSEDSWRVDKSGLTY